VVITGLYFNDYWITYMKTLVDYEDMENLVKDLREQLRVLQQEIDRLNALLEIRAQQDSIDIDGRC
jgi:chemotaxis regulatin CheY-phosphate phosphatase CheZ|tara:strand:- start:334 stop:531 length:198 start_codon:yes stop_codon:yes gene_type:complete